MELNTKFIIKMARLANKSKDLIEPVIDQIQHSYQEEADNREEFKAYVENMTDEELQTFIPSVYQKDIYQIDYQKLKEHGIKLISFDIDDTISDSGINKLEALVLHKKLTLSKNAVELFKKLKEMGFIVTLVTNSTEVVGRGACKVLSADDYIARASKPETFAFENLQKRHGVEKSEMAHVGNSMRQDIKGGNDFGITTCLIRRAGFSMKIVKAGLKAVNLQTKGHIIREELRKRDLWHKHHHLNKGDQYYQLGEEPRYRSFL